MRRWAPDRMSDESTEAGLDGSLDQMSCRRCHGFMYPVDLLDWATGGGHDKSRGWRCIACGEIIDETILCNRDAPRHTQHPSSHHSAKGGRRYATVYPASLTIRRDEALRTLVTIR